MHLLCATGSGDWASHISSLRKAQGCHTVLNITQPTICCADSGKLQGSLRRKRFARLWPSTWPPHDCLLPPPLPLPCEFAKEDYQREVGFRTSMTGTAHCSQAHSHTTATMHNGLVDQCQCRGLADYSDSTTPFSSVVPDGMQIQRVTSLLPRPLRLSSTAIGTTTTQLFG